MKIELQIYEHAANGVSLQIFPETAVEATLLRGIFRHGRMKKGHPCKAEGTTGFYISCWGQGNENRNEGD